MPASSPSDWIYQDFPPAGLGRRLMALLYDGLLLIAIWFLVAGAWVLLYPLTDFPVEQINGVTRADPRMLHGVLFPLLIVTTWGFYAWFWLHGGQTLGMRAWRLLSRDYRRRSMSLWQTVVRFLGGFISWATLGAGWLLVLLPPNQTLHDRLSATETVVVPKAG